MQRIANPSRAVRLRSAPPSFLAAWLPVARTSHGVVQNQSLAKVGPGPGHSAAAFSHKQNRQFGELALVLALSGGGTRASALSYGVLQELRDTQVSHGWPRPAALDAVSLIRSVSGGSFTSAYYGQYGDRVFVDFEQHFLRRDVEGPLIRGLLDPLRWFSSHGRTEMAVDYYRELLFGDATFDDLLERDGLLPGDSDLQLAVDRNLSYAEKRSHRDAHFVDGGITDNLRVRDDRIGRSGRQRQELPAPVDHAGAAAHRGDRGQCLGDMRWALQRLSPPHNPPARPGGEIGRRSGLKIRRT